MLKSRLERRELIFSMLGLIASSSTQANGQLALADKTSVPNGHARIQRGFRIRLRTPNKTCHLLFGQQLRTLRVTDRLQSAKSGSSAKF